MCYASSGWYVLWKVFDVFCERFLVCLRRFAKHIWSSFVKDVWQPSVVLNVSCERCSMSFAIYIWWKMFDALCERYLMCFVKGFKRVLWNYLTCLAKSVHEWPLRSRGDQQHGCRHHAVSGRPLTFSPHRSTLLPADRILRACQGRHSLNSASSSTSSSSRHTEDLT